MVATARPEALAQLLATAELAGLALPTFTLRPLDRATLPEVIEGPARLAGLTVSPKLVASLVDDTGSGAALPLLAFTLAQLAEGVVRGGALSLPRYNELGGVQGALIRQADDALTAACAASGRSPADVITGLLRLVTVDENGKPTRRRVAQAEPKDPVRAETSNERPRRSGGWPSPGS